MAIDLLTLGLIVATAGLAVAVLALLVEARSERKRSRDLREQNKVLREQTATLNAALDNTERISKQIGVLVDKNLSSLKPAFRAALSHYMREAYIGEGWEVSAPDFLESIHKEDPALEAAWISVEPNKNKRETLVRTTLQALREAELRTKGGFRIGSEWIPFGVPVHIPEAVHGVKARIAAKPWFLTALRLSGAFFGLLVAFPLLVALAFIAQAGALTAMFLFAPAVVSGLVFGVLYSVQRDFRAELSGDPEYMVGFDSGMFENRPCLVRFGELSATAFYVPPTQESPKKDVLSRISWKRISPNARKKWRRAIEPEDVPEYLIM